jgi:hypothetical protein
MKATNFERFAFWWIIALLLACVVSVGICCAEVCTPETVNGDKVTDCGRAVYIEGTKKAANNGDYSKRFADQKSIVDAEIARKHEVDIEAAKYAVALKLEEAGATRINVNAEASNSNSITSKPTVNNENAYSNSNR